MRHIVMWPARLGNLFLHYLINGAIFEKKQLLTIKCVFWLPLYNFVWNVSHSKKNWERYDHKMHVGLHVKYPLFLPDFNKTWILSTYFRKNTQISRKSVHADGRTDGRTDRRTMKLTVAFLNFAKAPETNTVYEFYELLKNIDFGVFQSSWIIACKMDLNKYCSDTSIMTPLYSAQCRPDNDYCDGKMVGLNRMVIWFMLWFD